MTDAPGVRRLAAEDVAAWYQAEDAEMALGDVLDPSNSGAMSVGFARYRAGARNPWTVTYDEALIVTRGTFSVRTAEEVITARSGEVIWLPAGSEVVYEAEVDTELVYVTYPHWFEATQRSEHASQLDRFHQIESVAADALVPRGGPVNQTGASGPGTSESGGR